MKVKIWPSINPKDTGEGGIRRVIEAQYKYLPGLGVEIVENIKEADLINIHADSMNVDIPIAASSHGLYWEPYQWMDWCYEANAKLINVMKRAAATSAPSKWVANAFARGMLLDPFVLYHGVTLEDWEPGKNLGYALFAKNRQDPICSPEPLNKLAILAPDIPFITTFGDRSENVKVLGRINHDQSKTLIKNAGLYLATTLETGAITVIEAMAAGVPALGFDWGANSEIIVHGETGYLVEPDDYNGLLEGLYYCLENRKRLGENARQLVIEKYQWKDRIRDYIPFFERALTKHSGPKVSVIITAYNLESYLPASIESVLNQTYKDFELIIVDDNSPDNCGRIAEEYALRDIRIKVIHNPYNAYLAEARNIGISHSSGEYILSLDADDMLSPESLSILVGKVDKDNNIDIACGGFELIEPDGRKWQSDWPTNNPIYDNQIKNQNQVPYASMMRRWVWERTGGYRRRMKSAEDAEFWTRAYSFGAVPAKVTDAPTLIYNNRPHSMSHSIATPDYNRWYTWRRYPEFTPFGCSGTPPKNRPAWPVISYSPIKLSVIVPVGPGHEIYLQDCLDSLVAQTFQNWEVILINDTGKKWYGEDGRLLNRYLRGFPFVQIVDSQGPPRGTAWARNKGIESSSSEVFVLLDADDYAQPLFLDVLYKAWKNFGGWAYTDWYDQLGEKKEAQDFDCEGLKIKMLGPSTGIYSRAEWDKIGGFDESILGWEDYDFQLGLLEIGSCGTRIKYPGFTYRYHTGVNRERDYNNAETILKCIRKKHKALYE